MTDDICGREMVDYFAEEGTMIDCQRPARHEGMCWQQPFYSDSNHEWRESYEGVRAEAVSRLSAAFGLPVEVVVSEGHDGSCDCFDYPEAPRGT